MENTSTMEHKVLTFKEVHAELEMENNLLLKEHNIQDFSQKANFLKDIGFKESKATKMYSAIVSSEDYRKGFNQRYNGLYKFILKEQLERVCEKYNLFVRKLEFFAGDIPEKNIKDMMNFRVALKDFIHLPDFLIQKVMLKNLEDLKKSEKKNGIDTSNLLFYGNITVGQLDYLMIQKLTIERRAEIENSIESKLNINFNEKISLNEIQKTIENIMQKLCNLYFDGDSHRFRDWTSSKNRMFGEQNSNWMGNIEIAAVRSLFTNQAFQDDTSRLGNQTNELMPTGQVDLDPIVMIKNNRGYIIITAWGDEANDELIVNQNQN